MIHRATWYCLLSLAGPLSACAAPEAPLPAAPPPLPSPPPATPVVSVEPPPTPAVFGLASPPPPVEFAVAVEGDCAGLDMGTMDEGETVYRVEQASPAHASVVFSRQGPDGVFHDDPALARGLTTSKDFDTAEALSGSWNERAEISLASTHSRTGNREYPFEWTAGRWRPANERLGYPYVGGSRLLSSRMGNTAIFHVEPKGRAATPDFAAVSASAPDCHFQRVQVATRPDGEVFISGIFCAPDPVMGVAWWKPGGGPARMTTLSGLRFEVSPHMEDGGKAGIFALATVDSADGVSRTTPFIGHFEKGTWTRVPLPREDLAAETSTDLRTEPDGTLWLTVENTLYRRALGGDWTKETLADFVLYVEGRPAWAIMDGGKLVAQRMSDGQWRATALPGASFARNSGLLAETIQIDSHGEPWIRATYANPVDGRSGTAILRHVAPRGAERGQPVWCSEQNVALGAWPAPAAETCATPLPILLHIGRNAPAKVDFPTVRKALAGAPLPDGVSLVEIKLAGQRVLAAKVPSVAAGRAVVAAVADGITDSSPELVCAEPEVTRALPPLEKRAAGMASNGGVR